MDQKATRELVGKLLGERAYNPAVRRWLRGLLKDEVPEAWQLLFRHAPPNARPEALRAIGVLLGFLDHDPERHPATALAPWEGKLLRVLKAPTGEEMARRFVSFSGLVRAVDLFELGESVVDWTDRRRVNWARRAWGKA